MRAFDIITDSGCDIPEAFFKEHGVAKVNLGFTMNNVNYEGEGGEHIEPQDFYAQLQNGAMPTTYQVTGEMAKGYMEKSLEKGNDLLVLTFSSGLSGTSAAFRWRLVNCLNNIPN